jgi:hypothetical protein
VVWERERERENESVVGERRAARRLTAKTRRDELAKKISAQTARRAELQRVQQDKRGRERRVAEERGREQVRGRTLERPSTRGANANACR